MVVVVVQARMGSSRLPGKVLLPVDSRPLLSYLLERLRRCKSVNRIIVATSTMPADDAIVSFCQGELTDVIRGPEQDVLARFAIAAKFTCASTVVRITADCPLIDPALVDRAVDTFVTRRCDYLSNMHPPTWPYGMAVEVMTRHCLEEAALEAQEPVDREHVTPFLYLRPDRYRLCSITHQSDLSKHRWTVDTPEDFELVSRILSALYHERPHFTITDILELLSKHPQWLDINRHILQIQAVTLRKE
jgi:spore coat polysaccharide biosynthesis protein SpsF